uniref:Uncharacterized protein n=1 Tax=Cricetulus griseus TaxID=10029 RepID=A0A8C2MKG1_CRIGR
TYLATAAGNQWGRLSRSRTPAPRFLREGRQCAAPPAGARGRLGPQHVEAKGEREREPASWRGLGGPRGGSHRGARPPRGTAAAPARGLPPSTPRPARLLSPARGGALLSRPRRVPVPDTHGACRRCRRSGSSAAGRAAGSRATAGSSRHAAAADALRSPRLHRPGTAGRRGRPPASPAPRAPPRPPGPCRGRQHRAAPRVAAPRPSPGPRRNFGQPRRAAGTRPSRSWLRGVAASPGPSQRLTARIRRPVVPAPPPPPFAVAAARAPCSARPAGARPAEDRPARRHGLPSTASGLRPSHRTPPPPPPRLGAPRGQRPPPPPPPPPPGPAPLAPLQRTDPSLPDSGAQGVRGLILRRQARPCRTS